MYNIPILKKEDFYYNLREEYIAKYPLLERNKAKLLVYKENKIIDDIYKNIYRYIDPESLVVFNDTRIIPARIKIAKETGAIIEIFLLEPYSPANHEEIFNIKNQCEWYCLIGNAKKWKNPTIELKTKKGYNVVFTKKDRINDKYIIKIEWQEGITLEHLLEEIGNIPLPPYIKREVEPIDYIRYQTILSRHEGSVAAPTASLHLTEEELENFSRKNIYKEFITLHITAGTFKPITSAYISEHVMHSETVFVKKNLLKKLIDFFPNIISSGTTTLRALESLYHYANKKYYLNNTDFVEQWIEFEDYPKNNFKNVLIDLYNWMEKKNINKISFRTQLMIIPGYNIRSSIGLITNFHQPYSTLLALVAAFIGNDWKKIYQHALTHNYRFLSYGDCSLLFKK